MITEFDPAGNLVKKTVIVADEFQSSIEINFDKSGGAAAKVKVYHDNPKLLDPKLGEFIKIAEKHSGRKLTQ